MEEDWQDNWSLQRRKFAGTSSPIPVPMLVPNPSTEAKVLIGDREVDDTSDLSEAASDFEDESESAQSLESILVKSKSVIGGKNNLIERYDGVNEVDGFSTIKRVHDEDDNDAITEAKNTCVTKIEDRGMHLIIIAQ